jgi:hypothetical protein
VDETRFDALTRRFSQPVPSRRMLLRALAGGGLSSLLVRLAPDATARRRRRRRHGRRNRRHHNVPNLCANVKGLCDRDNDCCDYHGTCICDVVTNTCDCGTICDFVDDQKGRANCGLFTGPQCCMKARNRGCEDDCQCCGDLRCQGGVCVPPPDICHGLAESCEDGEPCCPDAGVCYGGRCCLGDLVACPSNCSPDADCAGCCAGYCRGDGRCGPVQGCLAYGEPCTANADCCNDVPCIGQTDGTNFRCRWP